MKTIKTITIAILAALTLSLTGCYDDSDLKNQIGGLDDRLSKIEQTVNKLNSDYNSLKTTIAALEEKDFIKECKPLADGTGYEIYFEKHKPIVIKNGDKGDKGDKGDQGDPGTSGTPGKTPVISVKLDETSGQYCWTVDGVFVEVDGKYVPARGETITPEFKAEDGNLMISWNGTDWEPISDTPVLGIFKDVDPTTDPTKVTFTLQDGTTFDIPVAAQVIPLKIKINSNSNPVLPVDIERSGSLNFRATVEGADATTVFDIVPIGEFPTLRIQKSFLAGMYEVSAQATEIPTGKLLCTATRASDGSSATTVVSFVERVFSLESWSGQTIGQITPDSYSRYKSEVDATEQEFAFGLTSNDFLSLDFVLSDEAKEFIENVEWQVQDQMVPPGEPAHRQVVAVFTIKANDTGSPREGYIYMGDGAIVNDIHNNYVIYVKQAAAEPAVE